MNKIGFNNFRRFEKFEELEYSGITFLVGRNNAGKSTLVKALLLFDNYIKSGNIYSFSFGNNILEDANIVTYGRAKYNKFKEDKIVFNFQFDNIQVGLTISGDDDKSSVEVKNIIFCDDTTPFLFSFNFLTKRLSIVFQNSSELTENIDSIVNNLETRISEINKQLSNEELKKTSKEFIELNSEKEKLELKLADIKISNSKKEDRDYELEMDFGDNESFYNSSFYNILDDNIKRYELAYLKAYNLAQETNEPSEEFIREFEILKAFNDYNFKNISTIFDMLIEQLQSSNYVYLGANAVKQSALFAIRDKGNSLAQAIHDFKQLNIIEGEPEHRFIIEWMKVFDIGNDFEIIMHSGEAYEMRINPESDNLHLADKGMGSIQIMSLIMKISCAIKKHNTTSLKRGEFGVKTFTTIIIEEPELNLHPALQSKLADLFHEVNKNFGINFIIETHSEYLIRNTQLIVKENEYEVKPNENPFTVIYFDRDFKQWPMNYREDGKFVEKFGAGFFDVSANLAFDLL